MTTKTIAGYPKLLPCQIPSVLIFSLMIISTVVAWQPSSGSRGMTIRKIPRHAHLDEGVSRRKAMNSIALLPFIVGRLSPGHAAEEQSIVTTEPIIQYENRNRNNNKDAIIREDYWFMMGKTPPRRLPKGALAQTDDPQWNAFGSCQTQNGNGLASNSCTYVSWKQRIPAYSKYGFSIALGAKEYSQLGRVLREAAELSPLSPSAGVWNTAASYVFKTGPQQVPPPTVDALVKMVLFASGMLTSPNYSGPNKRLLVARYYANETSFAIKEIQNAIEAEDAWRAVGAWEYGKDSFNSWIECVNDSISPKVGDKFELIT